MLRTSIIGFPRIGEKRELKRATENYFSGKISADDLKKEAYSIRKKNWLYQKENGIDLISVNDFSFYDNMLDTLVMLDAIPDRFKNISCSTDRYFAMARGENNILAMEMTKWFNTNYHYIVPELDENIKFSLNSEKIELEIKEALDLGLNIKVNIIGPLTFLALSKDKNNKDTFNYLDKVVSVYQELISKLLNYNVLIQIDEPILVKNIISQDLVKKVYSILGNEKIIIATYFEHIGESLRTLLDTKIFGLSLDFIHGDKNFEYLVDFKDKKLFAGFVDGRNIWANNIGKSINLLDKLTAFAKKENIIVSSSCSLLHVPYSLEFEKKTEVVSWMSFAYEKVIEISIISKIFNGINLTEKEKAIFEKNKNASIDRKSSTKINNIEVQNRLKNISKFERDGSFEERIVDQKKSLSLPLLPTTTIGSFPQTDELRKLRSDFKKGDISVDVYENGIKAYIDDSIQFQEEIGLDVLVHGEPERRDMVEYFGELLEGFYFTENGWVQSYGTRCVKPPVIYGDVSRKEPMTVRWIVYAQNKTKKIMKGMLTGPVTILNWSFVRDDVKRSEVSHQIAVSLMDEIDDLQKNGIKIIQVDEAAFKEGYPIRKENIKEYEDWAVKSFKLAVSLAKKETQIHTHMCYSDFNDIIKTLEAMDADVITIETARSNNELLEFFTKVGYKNEIGPGVYDIHSPRVPNIEEFNNQIKNLLKVFSKEKLWINPDCGLKTRKWKEVKESLINMVNSAKNFR